MVAAISKIFPEKKEKRKRRKRGKVVDKLEIVQISPPFRYVYAYLQHCVPTIVQLLMQKMCMWIFDILYDVNVFCFYTLK